jgi:SAM-dependent methyltransferase
MREQRLVFGEVAELYDRARAGYPESVINDVLTYAGTRLVVGRALEVGAGTGKATVAFAARGLAIVALEPDPAMAAIAIRNCQRFPGVLVETVPLEEWQVEVGGFDLVYSAQAWHWVRPEVRYVKAAEALRSGGSLALLWHRIRWPARDRLRDDLEEVYRRCAPDLYSRHPAFPGLTVLETDSLVAREVRESEQFTEVETRSHPWSATLDQQGFIDLLSTQSDHRLLAEEDRARLFDALRQVVSDHGGRLTIPHETFLLMARLRRHGS